MTDKEKILYFLEEKGISKSQFYKKTGFSAGFLDSGSSLGVDKLKVIVDNYPDFNPQWLLTYDDDETIKNEIQEIYSNGSNNNLNNNINGKIKGNIHISHNDLTKVIELVESGYQKLQHEFNERLKTSQIQLSESQKQINTLLEIIKKSARE